MTREAGKKVGGGEPPSGSRSASEKMPKQSEEQAADEKRA
jgi:hypothetical protein